MHFIEKEDYSTPEARAARYPWGTPPPKIDESLIAETVEADVAIIGGGISGLATGARCVQLGQTVVVAEKSGGLVAHGAHVASVGSQCQRDNGVYIDKRQFARDWMRICGSRVNEDLLWLYVNKSEAAFEWLLETGGEAVEAKLFGGYYKGPDFTEYPGTHVVVQKPGYNTYKYKGGALLMVEILDKVIRDAGQRIDRKTVAKYLEKDENGRVVSFIAQDKDGVYRRYVGKKAVVLATGDIGADREMMKYFAPLGLVPEHNGYYPAGLNTGDGHKMAYWAGAEYEQHDWALSMHLIAYSMYTFFFLHVNREGRRYMNEDTWVQAKAIRTAQQPRGQWAWSVFDARWADQVRYLSPINGGQFVQPLMAMYGDPWKEEEDGNEIIQAIDNYVQNGLCCKADTLEELAEQMDVPVDTFLATVARYNKMYEQQNDEDYGKRTALLTPITKPPYYALKFGPSMLDVFGGVNTDVKLRVLDADYKPIPGLLAVGMIAGGLYGVDYPLLFNGNSHGRCLTWGRQAAETIANGES
ncbi:MAG: FAD-binding protein [Eubacterium sp.]|nr:FAD-binding protein [Eubacterium sp.]